jgi:diguanylate cyclase (GGDEF)-like protein
MSHFFVMSAATIYSRLQFIQSNYLFRALFIMLRLHKWKLLLLGLAANFALLASLAVGDTKALSVINWLDVVSEGGAALLAFIWLLLILHSRPAGRVTQLLSLGLSAIVLSGFQDLLDEFIRFPDSAHWDHWIESGFMPIGLTLLTVGIYHWHKEQLILSAQLRKRERLFREHRGMDFITALSGATYLRQQLMHELPAHQQAKTPLALLLIDIDNFGNINRQHGHSEGDHLLQSLGELLLLNIRRSDLLCRYAGDRFALLLPNTGRALAEQTAKEITAAVKHFAYKTNSHNESLFHSVSIGIAVTAVAPATLDTPESLIQRANIGLLHAKENRQPALVSAA